MELLAGTLIAGRFRLVRPLGEGGMGVVWQAVHVGLDTPCALKLIHEDAASDVAYRGRFEREAKAAAQLRSPHVVQVLDYGEHGGVPYIAMELLDGEDLAHRLARVGRLGAQATVTLVGHIAKALTRAHAAELVHRDLKPENVFLVRDDEGELAKVLDFGIAKWKTGGLAGEARTKTGALIGTPYYMSPEQMQGTKELDHRADLWSLAVIAFRCLVGRLPFESAAIGDLLLKIMVQPLPVPSQWAPDLPPSFDAWWARGAARDPAQRFQTARELADALADALGVARPAAAASSFDGSPAAAGAAPRAGSGAGPWSSPSGPGQVAGVPAQTPQPWAHTPGAPAPMASSGVPMTPSGVPMTPSGALMPPSGLPVATSGAPASGAQGFVPPPVATGPGAAAMASLDGSARTHLPSGAPATRAPLVLGLVAAGLLVVGVGTAIAWSRLHDGASAAAQSATSVASAAEPAPSASAPAPEASTAEIAAPVPTASATAAAAASTKPAAPPAPPPARTAKPAGSAPPPPARTGRVVIPPPPKP